MTDQAFTTCLWFDTEGEAAASFYTSIFPDSKLGRIGRYNEAGPGPAGSVMAVEFDYYWDRLTQGGQEVACGWLKDKYGLSWQVVPTVLIDLITDPDPDKANRATQAMLSMTKFDIAAIQRAYAGE